MRVCTLSYGMNNKTGPKDVFLHLLSILWLYVSVGTFINLIFQIIDNYFPDTLSYGYQTIGEALKWPLSVLVVAFPLFVVTSYYLEIDLDRNPKKHELKIRKWLFYFTLSLASVVIAGDIIALILTYLNGEITARFVFKVLSVFAVAISVFAYYLWYVRNEKMALKNLKMKIFIYVAILVVLVFIVWGFVLAGSPQSARLRRFDNLRINDLQMIQSQIVNYYQAKQKLPASLEDLKDPISGFVAPQDPETNLPFEYNKQGDLKFQLCANFSTESTMSNVAEPAPASAPYYNPKSLNDNWSHGEGTVCFDRVIDPQLYPPITNLPVKK